MLRIGLTGGLGSGKSTVANLFARKGVQILEADLIGRELMQPGHAVYEEILRNFQGSRGAPKLTLSDGQLDRAALAQYVFSSRRLGELNRLVHPAVIAEQELRMARIFSSDPQAMVMVESALIFEADRAGTAPGLSRRFDQLILVTAPEDVRVARYVARVSGGRPLALEQRRSLEDDALRRMSQQIPDAEKAPFCNFVVENYGPLTAVESQVSEIYPRLKSMAGDETVSK